MLRSHIGQRSHDEAALPHARMGNGQLVGVDPYIAVEQHIGIEGARSIAHRTHPARFRFQGVTASEKSERIEKRVQRDHQIEIRTLTLRTANRVGLVDLGHRNNIRKTLDGEPQRTTTITQVRSERNVSTRTRTFLRTELRTVTPHSQRRRTQVRRQWWIELAHAHLDQQCFRIGEQFLGDPRGHPLQQHMTLIADDPLNGSHWYGVVDRCAEVVSGASHRRIEVDVDIYFKRLSSLAFLRQRANDANHSKAPNLDLIHGVSVSESEN